MKAAIICSKGSCPVYGDIANPQPEKNHHIINVKASALSQLARHRAAGTHYSSSSCYPFIAGVDGTGYLDDGTHVYFLFPEAPWGSMAQQVPVPDDRCIIIPDSLNSELAAAIANPGMSSWAALTCRAKIAPGDTVLINGATGASGSLAVKIARYLGAGTIIVTGRNEKKLTELLTQGADTAVLLSKLNSRLPVLFKDGIDIVLDYLWGDSALAILNAAACSAGKTVKFVQIGGLSSPVITLDSKILRSADVVIMGSGLGSVSMPDLTDCVRNLLQAAATQSFSLPYRAVPLCELENNWEDDGSRVVFTL